MKPADWAVYEKGRGFFAARYKGREGLALLAGGETDAEQRERAHRLAGLFNADREAAKVERKGGTR